LLTRMDPGESDPGLDAVDRLEDLGGSA
jgi:hypothetical protein